jgi:conjugative transfer pilus assembly protein TraH
MVRKIISIAILLSFFTVSFQSNTSGDMGQFLDDAMTQLQGLSPKAYQGQQRGYYMGGSASIRIPQDTIQPFSFTPPKISAGCGGIDIAMGGFSYLNFDALVQKLQKILQAAPAMAFDLALGVLCEQCKTIMHDLEQFSNMINSLNMDSCKATKAILGFGATELQKVTSDSLDNGSFDSFFRASTNANSNWASAYQNFITEYSQVYDCHTLTGTAQSNCNAQQAAIAGFKVPLWEQVFNGSALGTWLIPIFRGYYGEIFQQDGNVQGGSTNNQNTIVGVGGCANKAVPNIVDALVFGTVTVKNALTQGDNDCQDQTDLLDSLSGQVHTHLTNILTAIQNGTTASLQPDDINIINASRVPVYQLMSLGSLYEKVSGDTSHYFTQGFVDSVTKPIAYDVAVITLKNVLKYVDTRIQTAFAIGSNGNVGGDIIALFVQASTKLRADILEAEEYDKEAWKEFQDGQGDEYLRAQDMQAAIYKKMSETKILSSLQWARGIR